jgi:hypothetical protein
MQILPIFYCALPHINIPYSLDEAGWLLPQLWQQ